MSETQIPPVPEGVVLPDPSGQPDDCAPLEGSALEFLAVIEALEEPEEDVEATE